VSGVLFGLTWDAPPSAEEQEQHSDDKDVAALVVLLLVPLACAGGVAAVTLRCFPGAYSRGAKSEERELAPMEEARGDGRGTRSGGNTVADGDKDC